MYSISDAISDCSLLSDQSNPGALSRLESFIENLNAQTISKDYLDIAIVFWKMPFAQSVRLAHTVIERYLLDSEAWADIQLWAYSAIRQAPVDDTVWISRNYYALALQAVGKTELAHDILRENWMAGQAGSGDAYEWITGRDLSVSSARLALDKISGKQESENKFLGLRASWLDEAKIANVRQSVLESLENMPDQALSQSVMQLTDEQKGLTYHFLKLASQLPASDRQNGLLGIMQGTLAYMRMDDSSFLIEQASQSLKPGGDPTVAIDRLSIAVLLQDENAYVQLARLLYQSGLAEAAMGYANVAVWANIPGSANLMIEMLGLDQVTIEIGDTNVDEAMKVQLYKLANGMS